jgi:hypothetical protein
MRRILLSLMLVIVSISPVIAAQATVQDRMRMSVEIADYIRDSGKSNEFHAGSVNLGAAVIEGHWAIADWRSEGDKLHGQVAFAFLCDHWNLERVTIGRPLRVQDLVGHHTGGSPVAIAEKLVADLKSLETQHIAYMKPAHAGVEC